LSPELIAILGIGIALAGLILRLNARIDSVKSGLDARIDDMKADMVRMENSLGARIDDMKADMVRMENSLGARIDGVQTELREVRDRLSRLEGKVDILQDYIMRRNDPAPAAE